MMRGVKIICFFFTLKTHEKIYLSSRSFLVSDWFRVLGCFFFLEVMNWFNKVSMVFYRGFFFVCQNGFIMSFWAKKKFHFSGHTSGRVLGLTDDMLFLFYFDKKCDGWHVVHLIHFRKRKRFARGAFLCGSSDGPSYQTHNVWPHSFLFFYFSIFLCF